VIYLTLGIVICLENAVLLIAEGIVTKPYVDNEVVSTDDNKITIFNEHLAGINFGVNIATEIAVKKISENLKVFQTPSEVMKVVENALVEGWAILLQFLDPTVDKNDPHFKAAVIVAGFLRNYETGFFIGGVLQKINTEPMVAIQVLPKSYILLGSDEEKSKQLFQKYINELISKPQTIRFVTDDIMFNLFLDAAHQTIRHIEKVDPTIGGTVRFVIITRKGLIQGKL
jgi:hypothetical protein